MCRDKRIIFGSWFFFSATWVPGIKIDCHTVQQAPLPGDPSCRP